MPDAVGVEPVRSPSYAGQIRGSYLYFILRAVADTQPVPVPSILHDTKKTDSSGLGFLFFERKIFFKKGI
ncbi:hypothetical protein VU01_100111 [Candidatus Electrothrix marina]|uniref:Uncharacterized protein n=1 Tax=Candidatus Electrothrix marina TaxID=1859130 RepID=A0A3S3UEZ3_9BACT|nr:hypothetical protein VT99_10663 [Candidatus Electrothrix marina]RWX52546.1 hypothetical protein VU01_100111 [Candidatus Electrothrix marina]